MFFIIGIIAAYVFIGGTFGSIVNLYLVKDTKIEDVDLAAVFSGIFWPIAGLIWAGYYFARYIVKRERDKIKTRRE